MKDSRLWQIRSLAAEAEKLADELHDEVDAGSTEEMLLDLMRRRTQRVLELVQDLEAL